MALIAESVEDSHLADDGTLTIRDLGPWHDIPGGPLALWALDVQPCGTFVRAGEGWFEGAAGDASARVVLERHDGPPPIDIDGWDDVAETPFRTVRGAVGLAYIDGGGAGDFASLDLGGPGLQRVRASRRLGERGPWRLQFWPTSEPTSPVWLARSGPAVFPAESGWWSVLDWTAQELASMVLRSSPDGAPVTPSELSSEAGWLDSPVWPDPALALPTGYPERDEVLRAQIPQLREDRARRRALYAGVAAQLGVAAPETRRDIVDLLVAAGVLEVDGDRYRNAPTPPRAQDVLDLPPEQVRAMNEAQNGSRYGCVISDLVSIALWTPGRSTTVTALAASLLTPVDDTRGALLWAVHRNMIALDGDAGGRFTMTVTIPVRS